MATFRVTETLIRGPFANDACFMSWLTSQSPSTAYYVSSQARAGNNGGPDDRMFHIWAQLSEVPTPKCPNGAPTLVTYQGKNGWSTAGEAAKALTAEAAKAAPLDASIAKANAAATSPAGVAGAVAKDVAKAGEAAADVVKGNAGTVAGGVLLTMGLYVAAIGGSAYVLWRIMRDAK